jgi:class 3 adenylate cyclase/pimeloyl-ACP methyl ester carboxylesterase
VGRGEARARPGPAPASGFPGLLEDPGIAGYALDVQIDQAPPPSASRTLAATASGAGLAVRGALCHNTGSIVPRVYCGVGEQVMDKEPSMKRRLAAILAADIAGYSRLMGEDEAATVRDLKGHQAVILPLIGRYGGRIIDTAGDGILAEFPSVIGAAECAVEIQTVMATRNEEIPEHRRMLFRIGINLGDVIHDETRIYGDGINIAARLEGIAEPGGICISRQVFDQVSRALKADFQALGPRSFKNIARPVDVFAIAPSDRGARPGAATPNAADLQQEIHFCSAPDGVQLAYSVVGQGPALVKTGNWMTHLEYDLESPIWRHLYRELVKARMLIRYDARGNGLSDRTVDDISFDAFVRDLEAVIDAAKVARFALLGISQGCAVAIAYAVQHPERVSHLILYGGFAVGWNRRARSAAEKDEGAAMLTLMRGGWGKENPAFRQLFTSQFMPGATKEQADWFNELQRITVSPETAVRIFEAAGETDVIALLPRVSVPTLVMHARDDSRVPFDAGRRMAAGIPGARFVTLQGRNHLFLETEPAFGQFLEQTRSFLAS